jgi:alpha-mannosidase
MTTLTDPQRIGRLERRLAELALWTVRAEIPLDGWTFADAPIAHGAAWPTRDGVVAIARPDVEVPADWPLEETRLDIDLGGEGLLRLSYPDGTVESFGLDPNHQRVTYKLQKWYWKRPSV